jgi:hypothetical protein
MGRTNVWRSVVLFCSGSHVLYGAATINYVKSTSGLISLKVMLCMVKVSIYLNFVYSFEESLRFAL